MPVLLTNAIADCPPNGTAAIALRIVDKILDANGRRLAKLEQGTASASLAAADDADFLNRLKKERDEAIRLLCEVINESRQASGVSSALRDNVLAFVREVRV